MFKKPESVLVVVATKTGQVLLLRRKDDNTFWQSVTGSLEPEEQPLEAAIRELKEETGLTLADGSLLNCEWCWWYDIYPQFLHRYPKGVTKNLEHVFVFWLDKTVTIKLSENEHTEYCWLTRDAAKLKAKSETNQRAIEKFI